MLAPVLTFLAARSNLPEADANARDEWILGREQLWLTDYSGRSIAPELLERGVFDPLRITPSEHTGTSLSLAAAARVARVFADGGTFEGKQILPERFVARITSAQRKLVWEPIGEGELAVVTRPIFDSWLGVASIHRSTLTAVEPLVDTPIPIDDFARALEGRLGRNADLFMNELMKAHRKPFERRWQSIIGFGAFESLGAVVVLTRTKLIAVYAPAQIGYGTRNLLPLLRALE